MAARKKREHEQDEPLPREQAARRLGVRRALRFAGWTFGLAATVFVTAATLLEGEQFLNRDARFRLAERGPLADQDAIVVNGVKCASRAAVLRVFDEDRGRSLYELAPERRRQALRRLDWVRDASVRRVWPNRLRIDIEERVPVALIQVPAGLSGNFAAPVRYTPRLIDADGVILPVRGTLPRNLTLLSGLREQDDVERRRARVLLMMRILDELKEARERVVETDLSDPENVRLALRMPDRQVTLLVGNERFRERVINFQRHYDGFRAQTADRNVFDVSLEGRITAIDGAAERTQ